MTALTEGLKRGEQTLCYRNVREDGHSCSSWLLGCGTTGAHCTRVDAGRVDRLAWRSQHGPASFLPGAHREILVGVQCHPESYKPNYECTTARHDRNVREDG